MEEGVVRNVNQMMDNEKKSLNFKDIQHNLQVQGRKTHRTNTHYRTLLELRERYVDKHD